MRLSFLLIALVIAQSADAQRRNPTRTQSIQPCEPITTQPGGTDSRTSGTTGSQNPWTNPRGQILVCDSNTGSPKPPSKAPATFTLQKQTTHRVWSGFWWPTDPQRSPHLFDSPGPLDKYDSFVGTTTRTMEQTQHSSPGASMAGYQGHCDGWSVSSVLYNEPVRAVVASKTRWLVLPVNQRFEPGDVKGLLAALWNGFVWGKDSGGGAAGGIRDPSDLQAVDFHKLLLFYISQNNLPLVVNLSPDFGPVWNYPCDGFKMTGTQVAGTSNWNITVDLDCADDAVDWNYIGRKAYTDNIRASYTVTAKDPQNWQEPGLSAQWSDPGKHPWWIFCPIIKATGSPQEPLRSSPEYHHPYANADFKNLVEGLQQVSSGQTDSWTSGNVSVTVAK